MNPEALYLLWRGMGPDSCKPSASYHHHESIFLCFATLWTLEMVIAYSLEVLSFAEVNLCSVLRLLIPPPSLRFQSITRCVGSLLRRHVRDSLSLSLCHRTTPHTALFIL
jgi:hypothetical protein